MIALIGDPLVLVLGGLLAGLLGGLLGIGGGLVLMPLLRFAAGLSPPIAAGTCVVAVFFTTLGGSYRHHRLGNLHLPSLAPVFVAGALSTAAASLAFVWLARRGHWLDLGTGLVFLLVSARMISEGAPGRARRSQEPAPGRKLPGSPAQKIGIGAAAGLLPGLLGIGTGGVLVPAFTYVLRAPVKAAMAASLACFCLNALISSAIKISQGFTDLGVAVPACAGTLIGANLGVRLNGRFSSAALKLVFGLLFSYVSLKFLLSGLGVRI